MDLSKLSNEELMKIAKISPKFAGEVSKKILLASSEEGGVQVPNPAPNINKIIKQKYDKIQDNKSQSKEIKNFNLKDLNMKELEFQITKEFIVKNHYSHTISSSIKASIGFFYNNKLVTAIVYGHPIGINVGSWLQVPEGSYAELIRVFSVDELPKNTESYCLAKSFEFLKKNKPELKYLISYADPTQGHVGYIYQATNWYYVGKQIGMDRIFKIDGKQVHRRTANAAYGTSSVKKLSELLGKRFEVSITYPKHIYLMCLGSRKEKKEWYNKFKQLPYPKIIQEKREEDRQTEKQEEER